MRESSSISVLDGESVVYVARVPTRRIMNVAISVGTRLPAYATSMGRVLLAGLDYSTNRYVVYVAAKPPRSIFKTIASRAGRTIIYLPLGQLSPVSLKKIRHVHVLDGYDKREIAKDYLR